MPLSPTDYNPWSPPCRNGEGRGAYVLQGWILAESPYDESRNLGIYNCRPPSVHGHERAGDTGFPVVNGQPHRQGTLLANWLWANRDHFGIQLVIWAERIISRKNPTWRKYDGPSPHIDHVHWELNWWGYSNLTLAIINQHLPGGSTPPNEEEDEMDRMIILGAHEVPALYLSNPGLTVKAYITHPADVAEITNGKAFGGFAKIDKKHLAMVPFPDGSMGL